MNSEQTFRWLFIAIFIAVFSLSIYFRRKARKASGVIPRAREGKLTLSLRLVLAAPLYGSVIAYMVNPSWMSWSSVPLPAWARWIGAVASLGTLPLLLWILRALGSNISETSLTKTDHVLVKQGPYRWVRHPLYTVATIVFISLGILAANWFIFAMAILIVVTVSAILIPREEAHLVQRFGSEYREYRERTGMLMPRLRR